jgi:hypothetical protein
MLRHACGSALGNKGRHPGNPRVARTSLDHEYGRLYGLGTESVQGLLARVRGATCSTGFDGGVVQLTGSVIENPHGLHLNTFKLSAKARLTVCSKIIGRPQTGQMTSFMLLTSSLIAYV